MGPVEAYWGAATGGAATGMMLVEAYIVRLNRQSVEAYFSKICLNKC